MAFSLPDLGYAPRRARAAHRREDDGDPPRQAPPGLRRQREQGARGNRPRLEPPSRRFSANLDQLPEDKRAPVRNNAGGHANHTLFWEIMGPGGGGEPTGALADAIGSAFGSFADFKATMIQNGVTRFGSGWSWLVWDGDGLAAYSTANQDSPIMEGRTPILGHRRLGARLLPQLPEPAPGLSRSVVERGQLGRGRREVRVGAVASDANPRAAAKRRSPSVSSSLALPVRVTEPPRATMRIVYRGEPSDGELIERIAGGDRPAFEELYRRYSRSVLGLALRRLGDRGRAEDASQEAFVAIWRSARTYDPSRGNGAPWLYAVARNAITDGLRRTPEPPADVPDGPSGEPDPSARAEDAWRAWRVHRALEVLPQNERAVIEVAYWRGLSQSEIAELLGIPLGTVKTRTRSALARLADALEGELE